MTTPTTDEIAVPSEPGIPGVRFRHYRGEADHAGMAAANTAARAHAGSSEVLTAESIARHYTHLVNSDHERDILIVEGAGDIVGYSRTEWRDQTDGSRSFMTICLLDPAWRRRGIGRSMLAWGERRLAEVARDLPDARPSVMRAYTMDADIGAAVLLESTGWTREGHGYEMVRPTLDDIPDLALPDGFDVRAVTTAEEDHRAWLAAADAFRDHRAEIEWDEAEWAENQADPHRDRSLWAIAYHGDEIAAGVQGRIDPDENAHLGVLQGYIDGVWTRPPYRRRGLARALLARVLVLLRDRGMTSAYLGVDGINPNQAADLYTSLGFAIRMSETDWTKPLPVPTGHEEHRR